MQTNKQTPLFACHFTQQMTHLVCKSSLSYGHHGIAWLRSRVVSFTPNIQKHLQNLLITLQLDQQCRRFFFQKHSKNVQNYSKLFRSDISSFGLQSFTDEMLPTMTPQVITVTWNCCTCPLFDLSAMWEMCMNAHTNAERRIQLWQTLSAH